MVVSSQKTRNPSTSCSHYLSDHDCFGQVITTLESHLPLHIHGSLTPETYFTQLLCLCLNRESIHSAQKLFQNYLSETAFRHHLNKFTLDGLLAANSELLWSCAAPHLSAEKEYECAIDYTHDPYYGKIDASNEIFVTRGQRKKSTTKFYTYATLSLINKNERFTLAVLPVKRGGETVEYVKALVSVLDRHNIRPKLLCMDGGFYSIEVMRFLQERRIPYVIPAPNRYGRLRKIYTTTKKQQRVEYVMSGGKKTSLSITLGVVVKRIPKGGKQVRDKYVYALYGVDNWSLKTIAKKYKHRFAIEATYRIRNELKPRTSTKNPVTRYLFALVAFVLENCWVATQIHYFTRRQRGPKVVDEDKLPLHLFVALVKRQIRMIVGEVTRVQCGGRGTENTIWRGKN